MKRPALMLLTAALAFVVPAWGQSVSEIPVQAGEKWWGLFAGNSPAQPFAQPFEVNTADLNGGGFYTGHLVSSAGRYIHGDEAVRAAFDGKKIMLTTGGAEISAGKAGRTLRQAFLAMRHREFNGPDRFPSPEFFTNIIYETRTDFGFSQNAADILAYARRLLDEGYPPGIMVLADGWRDPSQSDFDRRSYPDPKAFTDEMHRMGFRVMLTVRPYIAAYGQDYVRFAGAGLLVAGDQGAPWLMNVPEGVCAVVDVTRGEVARAIASGLRDMADRYGVDGFSMDCLDFIVRYDGAAVDRRAFLKAWQDMGANFALCEFIPGFPGYQTDHVAYVGSSAPGGYVTDVVIAGLAAGPFTFAMPAGDGGSDKDAVRSAIVQIMMPVARVPFAPWKHGFAADGIKRALMFRASIAEYMGSAFAEACKTLEPMIRPMEYMFAGQGFADCPDQYMLGDKYLIAPAVNDAPKRLVRLPRGSWRDMQGQRHKGPVVIEVETDGYRTAWFERN